MNRNKLTFINYFYYVMEQEVCINIYYCVYWMCVPVFEEGISMAVYSVRSSLS